MDTRSILWTGILAYAFPPIGLVVKVLTKVEIYVQDHTDLASVAKETLVHLAAIPAVAGTSAAAANQTEAADTAEGVVSVVHPTPASVRKSYRQQGVRQANQKCLRL